MIYPMLEQISYVYILEKNTGSTTLSYCNYFPYSNSANIKNILLEIFLMHVKYYPTRETGHGCRR